MTFPATLTIGQLAAHAGVTVRAIRHYHQCGLLAEPLRDVSGYRRYDAQAVVDLIRIKTLASAGVPLTRIQELLAAGPVEFAAAIRQIDAALRQKVRDLTDQRHRIAELAGGEQLFLPSEVVSILDDLRALGVSERTVRIERDAWIMMNALSPGVIPQWVKEKAAALADPEFRRIYLACDEAASWDPADPRLPGVARDMVAWASRQPGREPVSAELPEPVMLMSAYITAAVPAWQRLYELSLESEAAAGPDQRSLPNSR